VQSYFVPSKQIITKGSIGYDANLGTHANQVAVLRLRSMGNVQAALETQRAIDVWSPQYVILSGIAGGFPHRERYLGDVIVADQVIYYELAKLSGNRAHLRPQVYRPSSVLISVANALRDHPFDWIPSIDAQRPDGTTGRVNPKVHVGAVLSGEKVVASPTFLNEFRDVWPNIFGVEMEGAGVGLAAYQSETQPEFLLVKGISDWADESKNDQWQNYAAHSAGAFIKSLLNMVSRKVGTDEYRAEPVRNLKVGCGDIERLEICKRLYTDWPDIADYYRVRAQQRARFRAGHELVDLWDWLEDRRKLASLPAALQYFDRDDVLKDFPCLIDQ